MPFAGGCRIKPTTGIADVGAGKIAERTVDTVGRNVGGAGRIVALSAIRFTRGDVVADPGPILAGRIHRVPLKATHIRRLVPDRMGDAGAKLDTIVTTGITH